MDKAQAINAFWSSFGWYAIDEQSAYDEDTLKDMNITYPYISYETVTGNMTGGEVALTASLWDKSTSWLEISKKADEVADAIGYGGKIIKIDDGYLWLKLGSPFAQRMPVESNDSIRRIYINITAEYLTAV